MLIRGEEPGRKLNWLVVAAAPLGLVRGEWIWPGGGGGPLDPVLLKDVLGLCRGEDAVFLRLCRGEVSVGLMMCCCDALLFLGLCRGDDLLFLGLCRGDDLLFLGLCRGDEALFLGLCLGDPLGLPAPQQSCFET